MRILALTFLTIALTSCGTLLSPMLDDIHSSVTQYVQQDTCKKIHTAKIIDYRMRNHSFPANLSDLDSVDFNSNQLKITLALMWLSDSVNQEEKMEEFDRKWKYDCQSQFDSIALTPYQSDSIDIYTEILKFKADSTYSLAIENRRLIFKNDSLSKIKQMNFVMRHYDRSGNEIVRKEGEFKIK